MIPDYQSIMLPLLKIMSDERTHKLRELIEILHDHFKLSDAEKKELLPSGSQAIFDNRVGWAKFYLEKASLLKTEKRGYYRVTELGATFLKSNPSELKTKDLDKFKAFKEFKESITPKNDLDNSNPENQENGDTTKTPEEALEYAYQKLKNDLSRDLLDTIKSCSPSFFERLVVDMLTKMGYGGSRKDAGRALGKSGDGGIDGIIKEDKLGLDTIYIQAKRWENVVPVREIRDFAGALLSKKARKGIFITTSNFPKGAYEFVESIEHKIVLIDGSRLADLMFEYNVGLSTQSTYEVKRIDTDYFDE
ncbi:restriction system protein [Flavobacterium tiangeerense]|uniref:Restriction system protein n=1 Tax=Flavobacterium tiangeerense TaxID=459471 RepID=A0ABY3FNG4_9FLAO|nr:restriction endonuclease [Flavobacterium tiangeerense]TWI03308.1 restriction system protein [Flavobacterium tiangeerense]